MMGRTSPACDQLLTVWPTASLTVRFCLEALSSESCFCIGGKELCLKWIIPLFNLFSISMFKQLSEQMRWGKELGVCLGLPNAGSECVCVPPVVYS